MAGLFLKEDSKKAGKGWAQSNFKRMLPKKSRASTKEIEQIFKTGRSLNSPCLSFKYVRNADNKTKISFIAPKNIAKLSTKRNLLRRRGYFALKKYTQYFPAGITGVFLFKCYQENLSILEHEIKNLLHKIN